MPPEPSASSRGLVAHLLHQLTPDLEASGADWGPVAGDHGVSHRRLGSPHPWPDIPLGAESMAILIDVLCEFVYGTLVVVYCNISELPVVVVPRVRWGPSWFLHAPG